MSGLPGTWNTAQSHFGQAQSPAQGDIFDDDNMVLSSSVPENFFNSFGQMDVQSQIPAMFYEQYSPPQPKVQHTFSLPNPASTAISTPPNHMSILSKQLEMHQLYPQEYQNRIVPDQSASHFNRSNSLDQMTTSAMNEYFGNAAINFNEQEQHQTTKYEDEYNFALLSPIEPSSKPIPISGSKSHGRTSSISSSVRLHPYREPSFSIGTNMDILSPKSPASTIHMKLAQVQAQFAPHQQAAAQAIISYINAHPTTPVPAAFISSELAEVRDGRGWCLIGNCGHERAMQKSNPSYELANDGARKRLDHLYDHIRDKHFECRPYRCGMLPTCSQAFSREHDLKRHEKTHQAVSLPCYGCGKKYTRDDNLKRHVQTKHVHSLPGASHMRRPHPTVGFTC